MPRTRNPQTATRNLNVEIHTDHITAVIWIDEATSIGVRFNSPEHLLEFSAKMMEAAAKVWPDNPFIKEYFSD